jgi:DNA-binding SARP family transcriptional activator/tetratricopeptide (TPR) repeat protein
MADPLAGPQTPDRQTDPAPPQATAPTRLRLRLIGRMEALGPGAVNVLPRVRKTRALLAILAMANGAPVGRVAIAALLWSTRDREQARASLRQSVHELNASLNLAATGPLIAERMYLQLPAAEIETDVRAVMRATLVRPDALGLMGNGALLEDLVGLDPAFDRWLSAERAKLAAAAALIAEQVMAARLADGAAPSVVLDAARTLLAIDQLRESGWRAMMTAHMAAGERGSAMAAFERCASALAEAGQPGPSAETSALYDAIRAEGKPTQPAAERGGFPAQTAPGVRLGVLPFHVIGGSDDEGLSIGLADEITNALARFRWISLIASSSLAAIRSGAADPRLEALGLAFLLEGTVQRGGDRVRVTVRLLDMRAARGAGGRDGGGEVIWARRFDRAKTDLFSLQDEVAAETVAQVDPELLLREAHRATARAPADPTAYDLVLRAIPALYRLEEAGFRAAGGLLAAAIARDDGYAPAHAWLAYWHIFLVGQGWAHDIAAAMAAAAESADRAVALDPADARALTIAGHVRSYLDHQLADAIDMHERALALNPNLPLAWAFSGLARAYAGQHDEAIRRINAARRLSPFDPHGFFFDTALMVPTLLRGDFEQTVELGRRAVHLNPALSSTLKGYLSALGHLGPSAEMLSVRARLLQAEPGFCVHRALARSPMMMEADRDLYATGLRRAGLPETSDRLAGAEFTTPTQFGAGWSAPVGP